MPDLLAYRPGRSLLHRLNPVTKLVVSACLVVSGFLITNLAALWGAVAGVLLLAAGGRVLWPLARAAGTILAPLTVGLFVVHGLFYPDRETALFTIGPVTVWEEGLLFAALVLGRVALLVLAFLTAIMTTAPKRLMVALIDKGLSPKLAYVFLAALQFVPDMQRRASAVLEAQQARGLDIKAHLWRRLAAFVALMGPLIGGALIATETRAMALEARAFSRPGPRTYLVEVDDPAVERAVRWLALAAVVAVGAWRILQ